MRKRKQLPTKLLKNLKINLKTRLQPNQNLGKPKKRQTLNWLENLEHSNSSPPRQDQRYHHSLLEPVDLVLEEHQIQVNSFDKTPFVHHFIEKSYRNSAHAKFTA